MSNRFDIFVPVENANDESVTIVAIKYDQGALVKNGDIVYEIETSKSIVEIEAPADGYFFSHYPVNGAVIPGKVCGYIGDQEKYIPFVINAGIPSSESNKFSIRALNLIKKHKLDLSVFSSLSRVKESDVTNYILNTSKLDELPPHQLTSDCFKGEHLVLWGAGLQSVVVLDLLASLGKLGIVKCIIDQLPKVADIQGIPVISSSRFDELITLGASNFHICIGSTTAKSAVGEKLKSKSIKTSSLIHPTAHVSPSASIGEGVYIGPFVYIGPEVGLGNFSQINNCSSIAHHSKLGQYVMISDACHIGGTVQIGDNSLLGIGVIVNRDIQIGDNVTIPSGEKIFTNILSGSNVKSFKRIK